MSTTGARCGHGGEQARNQLEAIKAAGTIVVGAGGAAALLLAARQQRTAEIALQQKDRDQADVARAHALQERVAAATEWDAEERRATELYTKAVEQLGAAQAPVRLGGLHSLERVAQNNPDQRQTVVNVLCAYLRMPYQVPTDVPSDGADEQQLELYRERLQEREVRHTAQRILTHNLRTSHVDRSYLREDVWATIDLDLTAATLIDFDLSCCTVRMALFTSAVFARAW